MTKGFLVAAAIAGGLLLAPLASQPAAAVPMVQADMMKSGAKSGAKAGSDVMPVRKGGRGGMRGGGGGRKSFGGGGGRKSFGGGGGRKSFGGGGRRKSFGGGGRRKSFGGYSGGRKSFRRGHRRRHRSRAYYLPYVPYYQDYGYYADDCAWLRRKALRTDSSYWWRRYEECRYGY